MANKVEEMIAHEKFKGSEEDMRKSSCDLLPSMLKPYAVTYMRNYQMANPDRPVYAFCVDRKRAGQFKLTFITAKGQAPVSWVGVLSTILAALLISCVACANRTWSLHLAGRREYCRHDNAMQCLQGEQHQHSQTSEILIIDIQVQYTGRAFGSAPAPQGGRTPYAAGRTPK